MPSTLPFRIISLLYNAAPGAGSGTVTQATYTCPAGKWATLEHTFLQVAGNAAAANTIFAAVRGVIGGIATFIHQINVSGIAATTASPLMTSLDLVGGDTITLVTINTSAVNPGYTISIVIREYG